MAGIPSVPTGGSGHGYTHFSLLSLSLLVFQFFVLLWSAELQRGSQDWPGRADSGMAIPATMGRQPAGRDARGVDLRPSRHFLTQSGSKTRGRWSRSWSSLGDLAARNPPQPHLLQWMLGGSSSVRGRGFPAATLS